MISLHSFAIPLSSTRAECECLCFHVVPYWLWTGALILSSHTAGLRFLDKRDDEGGESRRQVDSSRSRRFSSCDSKMLLCARQPAKYTHTNTHTHTSDRSQWRGSYSLAAIRASDSLIEPPSPTPDLHYFPWCERVSGSVFTSIQFLPLGCGVSRRAATTTTTAHCHTIPHHHLTVVNSTLFCNCRQKLSLFIFTV